MSIYFTPPQHASVSPSQPLPKSFESDVNKTITIWLQQIRALARCASQDNLSALEELADTEVMPSNEINNPELAAVITIMQDWAKNLHYNPDLHDLATNAIEAINSKSSSPIKIFSPGKVFVITPKTFPQTPPRAQRKLNFDDC